MTARSPVLYLSEILASMDKIERYITGVSYDEFIRNDQMVDAVERNIEKMVKLQRQSRMRFGTGTRMCRGKPS